LKPFRKTQAERMYEQQLMAWQQQAALAADKGVQFTVPMPQPPSEQQINQEKQTAAQQSASTLAQMVAAGNKQQG